MFVLPVGEELGGWTRQQGGVSPASGGAEPPPPKAPVAVLRPEKAPEAGRK